MIRAIPIVDKDHLKIYMHTAFKEKITCISPCSSDLYNLFCFFLNKRNKRKTWKTSMTLNLL